MGNSFIAVQFGHEHQRESWVPCSPLLGRFMTAGLRLPGSIGSYAVTVDLLGVGYLFFVTRLSSKSLPPYSVAGCWSDFPFLIRGKFCGNCWGSLSIGRVVRGQPERMLQPLRLVHLDGVKRNQNLAALEIVRIFLKALLQYDRPLRR